MTVHTSLIDPATLAAMSPEDVLVVDCRAQASAGPGGADAEKGERDYREGHIPGAVRASLERDLSDLGRHMPSLGRHPLPSEESFSATLGRWGWRPGLQVVAYDAGSGAMAAARLWWLLRIAGVREGAVLDGGYAAWRAASLPVEAGVAARTPTRVDVRFDPAQVITELRAEHAVPIRLVLDARAAARYRGETEPLDRIAGHVPGALNRPFTENLGPDGRFKSPDELRRELSALIGDTPPEQVVHMCGSGVTGCHNLLAMEHAGLRGSRLYAPSWSGWVSDPTRPVAKG